MLLMEVCVRRQETDRICSGLTLALHAKDTGRRSARPTTAPGRSEAVRVWPPTNHRRATVTASLIEWAIRGKIGTSQYMLHAEQDPPGNLSGPSHHPGARVGVIF